MMTRQKYLKLLEYKLGALEPELRNDFLRELDSHIDDLAQAYPGESEEDTVLRLDSPDVVAEAILGETMPGAVMAGGSVPGDSEAAPSASDSPGRDARHPVDEARAAGAADAAQDDDDAPAERSPKEDDDARGGGSGRGKHRFTFTFDLKDFLESRMRGEKYHGPEAQDSFRATIPAEKADRIVVRAITADVVVRPVQGDISIEAEGLADTGHFTVTVEDRDLILREKKRLQGLGRIMLRVPARIEKLSVSTASGDISVHGIDAGLECSTASGDVESADCTDSGIRTVSGDIKLKNMAGRTEIVTASGNVELHDHGSDASVTTVSGDIECEDCCGLFRAETTSGNIDIEARHIFGGAKARTVSGDVECRLGTGLGAAIRAVTVSGDVRIEVGKEKIRSRQAIVGDGSSPLSISSVSGDLTVKAD